MIKVCNVHLFEIVHCNRAIADSTYQRRPDAAEELYMSQSSWSFPPSFFTLFPCKNISFYYFYRFSRHTQTYCKNLRLKFSIFYGTLNVAKIGSRMRFFLSYKFFFLSPIFKHFLIELECWNFGSGLGPPFCMQGRIYKNFMGGAKLSLRKILSILEIYLPAPLPPF